MASFGKDAAIWSPLTTVAVGPDSPSAWIETRDTEVGKSIAIGDEAKLFAELAESVAEVAVPSRF